MTVRNATVEGYDDSVQVISNILEAGVEYEDDLAFFLFQFPETVRVQMLLAATVERKELTRHERNRFLLAAKMYPWFPAERHADHFPQAIPRYEHLRDGHYKAVYFACLDSDTPDPETAKLMLMAASKNQWKVRQLKKALDGRDPNEPHYVARSVEGEWMPHEAAIEAVGIWFKERMNDHHPRSAAGLLASKLMHDEDFRRAVLSLMPLS